MIKKHYKEVSEEIVTKANATKTTIRWLITKDMGSERYATRRFEIQPGGKIDVHSHPEEHHIFMLEGSCIIIDEKGKKLVANQGEFLFIPSNEPHGYSNEENTPVSFLCIIPYL